jgi:uncharacterized protein HemY
LINIQVQVNLIDLVYSALIVVLVKLDIFTFIKNFIKTSEQAKKWIDEDNEALVKKH